MIYFESVKLTSSSNVHPYGMTLRLKPRHVHYLTSTNINNLNEIYNLFKNKAHYLDGQVFVDNMEVTHLNPVDFTNFNYDHLSFVDESLIFDHHIYNEVLVNIFSSFNPKVQKSPLNELLELFGFNDSVLHKKYKWLNDYDKWKLKLLLNLINPCEYLLIQPDNYDHYRENIALEMVELLEKICQKYQITILVFQEYNNLLVDNIIDVDAKRYYQLNKKLTISNRKSQAIGFNLLANRFNIYRFVLTTMWPIWLTFAILSLLFSSVSIFMLSLWNSPEDTTNTLNYLIVLTHHNEGLWLFGAYSTFALNIILATTVTLTLFYKTRKYLDFLNTYQIKRTLIALVVPLLILCIIILTTLLGFLFNIIVFELKLSIINNQIWWPSFYTGLAYLIYAFLLCSVFIVVNNKKTKLKYVLKKYISKTD